MTGIKVEKNVKMALGALGAFMTSGILHECCEYTIYLRFIFRLSYRFVR